MADSLWYELIDQADELADIQATGDAPTDADVRRAISAAYYALFHRLTFLVAECTAGAVPGPHRHEVRRFFAHSALNDVCSWIIRGGAPPSRPAADGLAPLVGQSVELMAVVRVFVVLQELRHDADYDHLALFTVADAQQAIQRADEAIHLLDSARDQPEIDGLAALCIMYGRRS
ncbi:MAG TPA: hypothetical protein VGO60_18470 [Iamia sp.]|jgi:hypothetical protein|nr:hypothetical protein [Iamia sp.]